VRNMNTDERNRNIARRNDDPHKVAKELRAKGISRFLFNIDDVGQFDSHWSVYVHEDEKHLLEPSE
jgi:hypothetical protein